MGQPPDVERRPVAVALWRGEGLTREAHRLGERIGEARLRRERDVDDAPAQGPLLEVVVEEGELGAEQGRVAGRATLSSGKSSRPMRRALSRLM